MKTYKGLIKSLESNQIFVFGSNTQGRHGKGTALISRNKFGAIYGQASGLQGQSYGLITTDLTRRFRPSVSIERVLESIRELYYFARDNSDMDFLVAYTGISNKNLSGFTNQQFADMFSAFSIPMNMVFEENFSTLLHIKDLS